VIPTGWPQNWHNFSYALTLRNINRFSKLFYSQNQENICDKDPTTSHYCVAILPREMSSVLRATIVNKTTSARRHFKKLTSWNINRCSKYYVLIFLHATDIIGIWSVLSNVLFIYEEWVGRLTSDDCSFIWNLRTQKGWGSWRMIKEFPNKSCGGIFSGSIITNFVPILRVK